MAIGSGLGASVGVAPEDTYGTYVAPTRFFEFASETLKRTPTYVQGGGIAAGRYTRSGPRRSLTAESASGDLNMDVPDRGFGLLLNMLLGSVTGPTLDTGATSARTQTHTLGDNRGKMFTAQVGVPDTGGTVRPYSFLGGKVVSAEFSCSVGELLNVKLGCDFRQLVESETLAAPSYVAGIGNFTFTGMCVKVGAVGAEDTAAGVTGMTLTISRAMKTDRQYACAGVLKAEPITNDYAAITGTITADYADKTQIADVFAANTSTSVVWEFTGKEIETGYPHMLRFTLPMTFFEGDTPQVSGPDVISVQHAFTVLEDGANPVVKVEYRSADTAI